jgi:putative ABC transport system substrate-binding protein
MHGRLGSIDKVSDVGSTTKFAPMLMPIVFLMLVASAPFIATAQPRAKVSRIGYLSYSTEASPEAVLRAAFLEKLRTMGHIEGRNITIEYRYAGGRVEKLGDLARELAALPFDVLVGGGIQASLALKAATRTIPIVSLSCDAVAAGLVPNLARPGGNVTGVSCLTPEMAPKRLQLLAELRPGLKRVAILWNAGDPAKASELAASQAAARELGVQALAFEVRTVADFEGAFAAMRRERVEALSVLADAFMVSNNAHVARHAATLGVPAVYTFKEFVESGGLLAYGPSNPEMYRLMAVYVDKILAGASPADLPIEQPTKFELVINLKTAKALGLTIPPSLLARADQIIE